MVQANMDCPSWKRGVCRKAGEVKILNQNYKKSVETFQSKRQEFYSNLQKTMEAYHTNHELNNTLIRVYVKTEHLNRLKNMNSDMLLLPASSEDPYTELENIGVTGREYDKLLRQIDDSISASWTKSTTMEMAFGGVGLIFSSAHLIYQASALRRMSIDRNAMAAAELPRFDQVYTNGIAELVEGPNGKYKIDDRYGHWEVDSAGKPIRKLSKGEVHQLRNQQMIDRSKVVTIAGKVITSDRRYFKAAKVANSVGKFTGRYVFPLFDLLGIGFCIYNIHNMVGTQIDQVNQQLNQAEADIQREKRAIDANITEIARMSADLHGNFTEGVADVTLMFVGLIIESVERGINGSNPFAISMSQTDEFKALEALTNSKITYDSISQIQDKTRHILGKMEDIINLNIRFAELRIKVKNGLAGLGSSPTNILETITSEGLENVSLFNVLTAITLQKPELDYYYNWPLCKLRQKVVTNQQQLDGLGIRQMTEILRSHVRVFARINSIPVNQIALFWNMQHPTEAVTENDVWRIIAREILPEQSTSRGTSLQQYRTC